MKPDIDDKNAYRKTPLRILFFEDDDDDVQMSLEALKASEFKVTSDVAGTPEGFLEQVRSRPYDVILSDFNMPSVSGMGLFELVRKEGVNIPFILVTGALGDEKAVECLRAGIADCVLKDRLARLPMAIRRALQ